MSVPTEWECRCADLLERIAAAHVAGMDPKPLQEQLRRLVAERPPEKRNGTSTAR